MAHLDRLATALSTYVESQIVVSTARQSSARRVSKDQAFPSVHAFVDMLDMSDAGKEAIKKQLDACYVHSVAALGALDRVSLGAMFPAQHVSLVNCILHGIENVINYD